MNPERAPIAYLMLAMLLVAVTIATLLRISERVYIHAWVMWALLFLLFALGVVILVLMWRLRRRNRTK